MGGRQAQFCFVGPDLSCVPPAKRGTEKNGTFHRGARQLPQQASVSGRRAKEDPFDGQSVGGVDEAQSTSARNGPRSAPNSTYSPLSGGPPPPAERLPAPFFGKNLQAKLQPVRDLLPQVRRCRMHIQGAGPAQRFCGRLGPQAASTPMGPRPGSFDPEETVGGSPPRTKTGRGGPRGFFFFHKERLSRGRQWVFLASFGGHPVRN